jgi:hypothetical protein
MKTYKLSFLKYTIRVTPDVPSAVAFCDNQEIVLSHEEMRGITGDHKKILFDLLVKLWEKLLPLTDRPAELAPMCTLSNYTIEENAISSNPITDHEADDLLIELEGWSVLCQESIKEMQSDFHIPEVGEQMELF